MSTKSQPNHHQTRGGCAVTTSSSAVPKKKPVFIKVEQLTPGSTGNNVVVNILEATNIVLTKPRVTLSMRRGPTNHNSRISECLVGDDTGTILFTARNDQVDLMKPGNTVILRNAKIDMFKGSMRLVVDKWGRIEVSEPATFVVKEDNNLSSVEYEHRVVNTSHYKQEHVAGRRMLLESVTYPLKLSGTG